MSRLYRYLYSHMVAARRRLSLLTGGEFDPYPPRPEGMNFSPSEWIAAKGDAARPEMDFSKVETGEITEWQKTARAKFRDLLLLQPQATQPEILGESPMPIPEGYARRRLYFRFAPGCDAPADIVTRAGTPKQQVKSAPVVICMQGTNAGAHLSLGENRMPDDINKTSAGSALALQAADNGFTAISFERAGFGERRERVLKSRNQSPTLDAAMHALDLGHTLLGQTVAELRALYLWVQSELAPGQPVYLAGYSAAGTASVAAAAAAEEFAGIAVGGCVGSFRDTLLTRGATGYNDIPGIMNWFEFDALIALIAPRPCIIIAGERDHIWPASGAEKIVASASRAWNGGSGGLEFLRPPGVHTYYPDLMWPALKRLHPAPALS